MKPALYNGAVITEIVWEIVDGSNSIQYKLLTSAHIFPLCKHEFAVPHVSSQ